jgi:hypothetical protein
MAPWLVSFALVMVLVDVALRRWLDGRPAPLARR